MTALWIVCGIIGGILGIIILYVLFLITCGLLVKNKDYDKHSKFYRFVLNRATFWGLFFGRVKVHVSGMENFKVNGRFVLVSNHLSKFDPIITWWVFRKYQLAFISKGENFKAFTFGRIIRKCCFRSIDRTNAKNAFKTILDAVNLIKQDEVSMAVYPEGTRNMTEEKLLPFHDGVFKIAKLAEVPVVVVTVKDTQKVKDNYPKRRSHVYLNVLTVIPKEKVQEMTSHEISNEVRELMEKNI